MIISAFAFQSVSQAKLVEFVLSHHRAVITQQIAVEAKAVTIRKQPARTASIDQFLADSRLEILSLQISTSTASVQIRDETDQGILNEAVSSGVDIILTGDQDFHALEIDWPRIMTPREFIDELMQKHD